jgi:putative serine protease PepD
VKTKAFIMGLVGGVLGAALIFGVFLLLGSPFVKTETTQIVRSAPASFASPGTGLTPEQIYRQATPGVVEVQSTFPSLGGFFGQQGEDHGIGTGFVVSSKGEILTNAHVVVEYQDAAGQDLATPQLATKVQVVFKGSGTKTTTVDATVVGADGASDVALLKVDPGKVPDLTPLPLGDSSKVQVGQQVVAIGNPLGLEFTMTSGIVSAVDRTLDSPTRARIENGIQTDAAINEGNSGGPLIDASGRVIGINEQIATARNGGSGSIGLGFAVPINTAIASMKQLENQTPAAWLGISGVSITPQVAQALNLSVTEGAEVASVMSGSPAQAAGLQGANDTFNLAGQAFPIGGDIVTAIDGQKVADMQQLQKLIASHKPGDRVTLTIVRDGKTQDVQVTLGSKPIGF